MAARPVVARAALACLLALGVAACGKRGSLERPPPLWGDDTVEQGDVEERPADETSTAPIDDEG